MIALAMLSGRGIQSALEPAGEHAQRIANLWDFFLVVSAVIYVLVMMALLAALFRRRRANDEGAARRALIAVTVASIASTLVLFTLLTSSVVTGRRLARVPDEHAPSIIVTGRQWWWQVDYEYADPSKRMTTANEITIPAGVPVHVQLRSTDVVHSFWIPNLHGKQDLIPGHENAIMLQASRPGVYRGQCAEFCGYQHAKMALWVNVLEPAEYARWVASERQSSRIPANPEERKGQEIFMSSPCPLCHNIQGTSASGKTAPDLTHFASRRSIAAGALPNNRGNLAGWILDPQHIKPGSYMPPTQLEQGELQPLIAYLESLR